MAHNHDRLFEVMKIRGRKLTEEEKAVVREHVKPSEYLIKYAVFKQHRRNGKYIAFIIDSMPCRTRNAGFDRSIEVIATRPICGIEFEEEVENFGCNNRIAQFFCYEAIQDLIEGDARYGIATPQKFIDYCKRLGYDKAKPKQIRLPFDDDFINDFETD